MVRSKKNNLIKTAVLIFALIISIAPVLSIPENSSTSLSALAKEIEALPLKYVYTPEDNQRRIETTKHLDVQIDKNLPVLLKWLPSQSYLIQAFIVNQLACKQVKDAIPTLKDMYHTSNDNGTKQWLVICIGQIDASGNKQFFLDATKDPSELVRYAGAEQLKAFPHDDEIRKRLIFMLQNDTSDEVRERVKFTLASFGPDRN